MKKSGSSAITATEMNWYIAHMKHDQLWNFFSSRLLHAFIFSSLLLTESSPSYRLLSSLTFLFKSSLLRWISRKIRTFLTNVLGQGSSSYFLGILGQLSRQISFMNDLDQYFFTWLFVIEFVKKHLVKQHLDRNSPHPMRSPSGIWIMKIKRQPPWSSFFFVRHIIILRHFFEVEALIRHFFNSFHQSS